MEVLLNSVVGHSSFVVGQAALWADHGLTQTEED